MTAPAATRPTCGAILAFSQDIAKRPIECHAYIGLRTFTDATGTTRHYCAAEDHEHKAKRRYGEPPRRVSRMAGCARCENIDRTYGGFGPPHQASSRCESGGRDHCSCDPCF